MNEFYTRAICMNGHIINDHLADGEEHDKCCEMCGAQIITACPSCGAKIKGARINSKVIGSSPKKYNNCSNCGEAYPWVKRAIVMLAKRLEAEGVEEEICREIQDMLPDIVAETPATSSVASWFKSLLKRIPEELALEVIKFAANFGCQLFMDLL